MKRRILIICMVSIGILTACGSSEKDQEIQNQETKQEIVEESEEPTEEPKDTEEINEISPGEDISESSGHKEYKCGDVITYTSGLKVTITDSGVYSKINDFDSTVVDQYAFIEVDIENTGSEDIAITGSMFKFYADGYALSNVWLNEENELPLSSNLSSGRKVKGRAYAEGKDMNSAKRIEAELGDAIILIYEYEDYGLDSGGMPKDINTLDLNTYIPTLYSLYNGDEVISLGIDDAGKLSVYNGKPSMEETYYTQTYDTYEISDNTLYGYVGDIADEFRFYEDGLVDVLLTLDGSTHYQAYIQEEVYFNTDWRKEFGYE